MTSRKRRVVWVYVKRGCEDEARAEARRKGVPGWLEPVKHPTPWGAQRWLYEWDQPIPLPIKGIADVPSGFLLPALGDAGS